MPALQVREFPEELYEQLKAYSAANHRSIAQQTIVCVENELARNRAKQEAEARSAAAFQERLEPDVNDFPNVLEASARARFVSPYARKLETEPEEVIEARRARRRRAIEEASKIHWKGPKPTTEDIVQMIRDDREHRGDDLFLNIERYFAEKQEVGNDRD